MFHIIKYFTPCHIKDKYANILNIWTPEFKIDFYTTLSL